MAFDFLAKQYLKGIKDSLTEDQWANFLKLTNAQKKTQIIAVIDADLAGIDAAILDLDNQKALREASLNDQKTKLNSIKTQFQNEL